MIVSFGGLFIFRRLLKKWYEQKEVASWENNSKCAYLSTYEIIIVL